MIQSIQPTINKKCKPRHGFYKINSDANLYCEGILGIGDVVRDSDGSVLAAAATWRMNGFEDPAKAMEFVSQCCFTLIIDFHAYIRL
ncbi:hypothetical protein P8452_65295 [Trifolium repens]|jgi:hypothetical protein|nr:hypothetical protein P8452_65295 [Trifolium repens]